jgi:hypothetical protein
VVMGAGLLYLNFKSRFYGFMCSIFNYYFFLILLCRQSGFRCYKSYGLTVIGLWGSIYVNIKENYPVARF